MLTKATKDDWIKLAIEHDNYVISHPMIDKFVHFMRTPMIIYSYIDADEDCAAAKVKIVTKDACYDINPNRSIFYAMEYTGDANYKLRYAETEHDIFEL